MKNNTRAEAPAMSAIISVIVLIISITIGIMIYFNVSYTGTFAEQTETYTGISANSMNQTLTYLPNSNDDVTIEFYDTISSTWNTSTAGTVPLTKGEHVLSLPSFRINVTDIDQVRVQYYTTEGAYVKNTANPTSSTVFTLAPIIAIVMIAGIILGIVTVFGRGNKV